MASFLHEKICLYFSIAIYFLRCRGNETCVQKHQQIHKILTTEANLKSNKQEQEIPYHKTLPRPVKNPNEK